MTKTKVSKRKGALAIAVGFALLGTVLLFSYVRGVERRALEGAEPMQVLVAKDVIPAGTAAADASARGLFETRALPKVAVMDGTVSSLEPLAGTIATTEILKGEQIVASKFAAPEEAGGLLGIPEGLQAMSVALELPPSVAGFIEAGDRVSVIAKVNQPEPHSRFLLQDIEVLKVGRKGAEGAGSDGGALSSGGDAAAIYTLAVTPADAEKLAFAVLEGDVYFTLLPPGQAPTGTPGRSAANLYQ